MSNISNQINSFLEKAKVYLQPGEEPPDGATVQEGPLGGRFYDASVRLQNNQETSRNIDPIESTIQGLAKHFAASKFELYEVGGRVRDSILGVSSNDIDLTTNAKPDETEKVLLQSGLGSVYPIGKEFGTIGLMTKDGQKVEITTFRGEIYPTTSRKPQVSFGGTLKEDLARRDFTINAMARDLLSGKIIDPFGGMEDLKNKRIRAVGNAKDRFAEDPLRMLRAVRFAAKLGFSLDVEMPEPEKLQNISKERIQQEFDKILQSPRPDYGLQQLDKFGLMKYIIPEIEDLKGVEQNKHHNKDAYVHTMAVVENAAKCDYKGNDKVVLMLSALLHDTGKPKSKTTTDSGIHFYGHHDISAEIARKAMNRLKYDNDTTNRVVKLVGSHMDLLMTPDLPSKKQVVRVIRKVSEQNFPLLLDLNESDVNASANPRESRIAAIRKIAEEAMQEKPDEITSPLSGKEIMEVFGIKPSKKVGEIKDFLTDKVIDGELMPDDKTKAEKLVRESIDISKMQKDSNKEWLEEFEMGMEEELEHRDITSGDPILTAKIVLAHLSEDNSYYSKLKSVMKSEGSQFPVDTEETSETRNQISVPKKVDASKENEKKTYVTNNMENYFEKQEKPSDEEKVEKVYDEPDGTEGEEGGIKYKIVDGNRVWQFTNNDGSQYTWEKDPENFDWIREARKRKGKESEESDDDESDPSED